MYQSILMPVDGSRCSEHAVGEGLRLARQLGSRVTFLYVVEDPFSYVPEAMVAYSRAYEELQEAGEEVLSRMLSRAEQQGVAAKKELVTGALVHPVDAIVKAAREHDLVLMGTHGRRGFDRWFLGSVTEGVLRRSTRPLLVIRCEEVRKEGAEQEPG